MGNFQSGQMKNLPRRENAEHRANSDSKNIRFRFGPTYESKIIHESSSSVDQFCTSQPDTSSNSSKTSVRLPVKNPLLLQPHEAAPLVSNISKTDHEQQCSGPSEEVDHNGGNEKNKSTLHQTPPKSPPKQGPKSVCQPPTSPQFSVQKTSASPKKASSKPVLSETALLLEKPEHSTKETKNSVTPTVTATCRPESKSEESATLTQSPAAQSSNLPAKSGCGGENKCLSGDSCGNGRSAAEYEFPQTDSRIENVNKQKALPDTQLQSDMGTVLPGVPCEKPPLKIRLAGLESEVKHNSKQAKMNTCTSKQATLLEPVDSAATTSTQQTPGNQAEGPTQAQNKESLSAPESVSHKNRETSAAAPARKLKGHRIRTAKLTLLPTSATTNKEEKSGHQSLKECLLLTKDCITIPSTNIISTSHTPSSTTASSRNSRPGGALRRREEMKQSKSKAVAKTSDILHSDCKEKKDQMHKEVQEETSGGAEKQAPTSPRDCKSQISKTNSVYTFGESRFTTFSELQHLLEQSHVKNLGAALRDPAQSSESQSPPQAHSATPGGQASKKRAAVAVVVRKKSTVTSRMNREVPSEHVQDVSGGPPSFLAAPRSQTKAKRKHDAKTMRNKTSKVEVKTEEAPSPASPPPPPPPPPPENPAHPEGRWNPFIVDWTCTYRCPQRGGALLPHNVRRWLDVKDNYLCEPPWVTTATLAASLAFRMKQEKSDFLL